MLVRDGLTLDIHHHDIGGGVLVATEPSIASVGESRVRFLVMTSTVLSASPFLSFFLLKTAPASAQVLAPPGVEPSNTRSSSVSTVFTESAGSRTLCNVAAFCLSARSFGH